MEMLAVLAIISIVTTFAIPLYSQYLVHTRRLEAAGSLSRLALAMEQYHIEHNTYQGATLTDLHFPETIAKNNYQLTIFSTDTNAFLLAANPLGKQAEKDQSCAVLTLHSNGEKGISGPGKVDECW